MCICDSTSPFCVYCGLYWIHTYLHEEAFRHPAKQKTETCGLGLWHKPNENGIEYVVEYTASWSITACVKLVWRNVSMTGCPDNWIRNPPVIEIALKPSATSEPLKFLGADVKSLLLWRHMFPTYSTFLPLHSCSYWPTRWKTLGPVFTYTIAVLNGHSLYQPHFFPHLL